VLSRRSATASSAAALANKMFCTICSAQLLTPHIQLMYMLFQRLHSYCMYTSMTMRTRMNGKESSDVAWSEENRLMIRPADAQALHVLQTCVMDGSSDSGSVQLSTSAGLPAGNLWASAQRMRRGCPAPLQAVWRAGGLQPRAPHMQRRMPSPARCIHSVVAPSRLH
jgi:hypothetical protein